MRNPGGQATWTEPDGSSTARDTITCAHCNRIVFVAPGGVTVQTDREAAGGDPEHSVGGICRMCMGYTCARCFAEVACVPFIKRVEREEEAEYRRRQNAKVLGL